MADDRHSGDEDDFEWEDEGTEAGGWERKPSDEEDRRHDDGSEPLAEPSDDDDDDLAEQEAGDTSAGDDDEGFDRPDQSDEEGVGDFGERLEREAEPLLRGREFGTPAGPLTTRSMLAIGIFVVVWCAVFFGMWALMGGIGILLGIFLGTAAGLGAIRFVAGNV